MIETLFLARFHVPDDAEAYTDNADVDTDDAGPCEDILVLAMTHSGPCEDA